MVTQLHSQIRQLQHDREEFYNQSQELQVRAAAGRGQPREGAGAPCPSQPARGLLSPTPPDAGFASRRASQLSWFLQASLGVWGTSLAFRSQGRHLTVLLVEQI